MQNFRDYISKRILLFDGAIGTLIYQKGIFIDKCYDELNLTRPDLIRSIHREYLNAGAMAVETNTFGANRFKLQKHNLGGQVREINTQGAVIAREVVEDRGFVAGSIGPLGIEIEPWGETSLEEARNVYREQAQALLDGGVDLFVLETFHQIDEIKQAINAVRDCCDLPIIAQMTVQEDGKTTHGLTIEECVVQLAKYSIDGVGINCTIGPKILLDFLERIIQKTSLPVSIMPNAGLPQFIDGRMIYLSTPEYFCVYAKRFIEAGARILGGCCGTTPEHIRKMSEALTQKQPRLWTPIRVEQSQPQETVLPEPVSVAQKSLLSKKLSENKFVICVELVSPRGRNMDKQIDSANVFKEHNINAVNIPDGPRATARMNGLAMAVKLQEETGMEVVLHYTCRDRNLLGMQSDLLGASVLGIKNILAITGDPPMIGDLPQSTAVFDIDSVGLTRLLKNLNLGLDVGNKPIGERTGFFIGVGLDPNSVNNDRETERLYLKFEAGAEFAITQPVFDPGALEKFLEKISDMNLYIIAGVWPLVSLRNAEFMRNEVPGVTVPDEVIKRIGKFDSKEDQLKVGIDIAREMVRQVQKFTHGIQISVPFGRTQIPLQVAEAIDRS
jgi:methionine synthase I (cobalamin-dependent)/5,10-methylenetetrahydrofolate reductase